MFSQTGHLSCDAWMTVTFGFCRIAVTVVATMRFWIIAEMAGLQFALLKTFLIAK